MKKLSKFQIELLNMARIQPDRTIELDGSRYVKAMQKLAELGYGEFKSLGFWDRSGRRARFHTAGSFTLRC